MKINDKRRHWAPRFVSTYDTVFCCHDNWILKSSKATFAMLSYDAFTVSLFLTYNHIYCVVLQTHARGRPGDANTWCDSNKHGIACSARIIGTCCSSFCCAFSPHAPTRDRAYPNIHVYTSSNVRVENTPVVATNQANVVWRHSRIEWSKCIFMSEATTQSMKTMRKSSSVWICFPKAEHHKWITSTPLFTCFTHKTQHQQQNSEIADTRSTKPINVFFITGVCDS